MTQKLVISPDLKLPAEALTETFAFLAKRGAGKTYAAKVLAEEMLEQRHQVVVLDPVSVWWGLRSSADGKKPGYPIAILGGPHGDVPLEATAGELVADLITGEGLSAILDVRHFSKNQQRQFVADFAERLLRKNRYPLHLFIEEAHMFVPQRALGGDERMKGATSDLVTTGRTAGITTSLITQRSARLDKTPLEQTDNLVILKTVGPNDRKAIQSWIDVNAEDRSVANKVMAEVPSLPRGVAWLWAPGLFDEPKKIRIRQARTFDSSATPKPGQSKRQPKTIADIDLVGVEAAMAETIERAKAEDPRELRRRIAQLQKQLSQQSQQKQPETVIERVEVPVFKDGELPRLEKAIGKLEDFGSKIVSAAQDVSSSLSAFSRIATGPQKAVAQQPRGSRAPGRPRGPAEAARRGGPIQRREPPAELQDEALSDYARGLLETMARHHPMKLTRGQISTLSGRRPRSSAFQAAMTEVVRKGFVAKTGDQYGLTELGRDLVGAVDAVPQSSEEIISMWRQALPSYERGLFDVLIDAYPDFLSREELSRQSGRSITSSAFGEAISRLVKNGLAEASRDGVRASETLFMAPA